MILNNWISTPAEQTSLLNQRIGVAVSRISIAPCTAALFSESQRYAPLRSSVAEQATSRSRFSTPHFRLASSRHTARPW